MLKQYAISHADTCVLLICFQRSGRTPLMRLYNADLQTVVLFDEQAHPGHQALSAHIVSSSQPYAVMLQGIALSADPSYKVLGSAYPWIARRLLSDNSPDLQVEYFALNVLWWVLA